jgi:hypothetical protein
MWPRHFCVGALLFVNMLTSLRHTDLLVQSRLLERNEKVELQNSRRALGVVCDLQDMDRNVS